MSSIQIQLQSQRRAFVDSIKMPNRYSSAHKSTKGPDDARPTAQQIIEDEGLVGNMKDKVSYLYLSRHLLYREVADHPQVFLITGCSSGIGIETARALSTTGARLFLGVRNLSKGQSACSAFLKPGHVDLLELDTSSLSSVRKAAAEVLSKSPKLNVLVCNAGIMMNPTREVSPDGFELQLATNYLGHFLLFWLLKDALLAASTSGFDSRLVNVSSSGHHASSVVLDDINLSGEGVYAASKGYGNSKTAQIWMANYVDRHFGPKGMHATSLMPGGIATGLQIHMDPAMKEAMSKNPDVINFMKSPEQGAATTVLAAVGKEWEGRGGKYLEDCDVAEPLVDQAARGAKGAEKWAYDEEGEEKLWGKTLELLELKV